VLDAANPKWIHEFLAEEQRICSTTKFELAIEHIGSTSIPNMPAKSTIDILIGAASPAKLDDVLIILNDSGYVLEGRRNNNKHSWLSYPTPEKRKFIIHLTVREDDEWKRRINFRDYLRLHSDTAKEYMLLKLDLAKKYPNHLNIYTRGKAAFVSSVLAKASSAM